MTRAAEGGETIVNPSVTVQGRGADLVQQVAIRGHRLTVDEPPHMGGMDAGPTPYELLTAALGS